MTTRRRDPTILDLPCCISCSNPVIKGLCLVYTIYNVTTLTYKTLATCQPSYLYDLLLVLPSRPSCCFYVYECICERQVNDDDDDDDEVDQPSRALRSSTKQLLHVPYMSTAFGRGCFQLQLSCNMEFHSYLH